MQDSLDERAHFAPVMRFPLLDQEKRTFYSERWCYLGSIDDWIYLGSSGPLRQLVQRYIPLLGTQALFEVF